MWLIHTSIFFFVIFSSYSFLQQQSKITVNATVNFLYFVSNSQPTTELKAPYIHQFDFTFLWSASACDIHGRAFQPPQIGIFYGGLLFVNIHKWVIYCLWSKEVFALLDDNWIAETAYGEFEGTTRYFSARERNCGMWTKEDKRPSNDGSFRDRYQNHLCYTHSGDNQQIYS